MKDRHNEESIESIEEISKLTYKDNYEIEETVDSEEIFEEASGDPEDIYSESSVSPEVPVSGDKEY